MANALASQCGFVMSRVVFVASSLFCFGRGFYPQRSRHHFDMLEKRRTSASERRLNGLLRASIKDKDGVQVEWQSGAYAGKATNRRSRSDGLFRNVTFAKCGMVQLQQKKDRVESATWRTGFTVWQGAFAMADYVDNICASWGDVTCIEVAAGLGLPSIVAARHGLRVIATEKDPEVLTMLENNLKSNLVDDQFLAKRVQVHSLDLQTFADDPGAECYQPLLSALQNCGGPDIILIADFVYKATIPVWGSLLSTLNRLREQRSTGKSIIRADGSKTSDPLVLLSYICRRRDMTVEEESRFFAMVREAGMELRLIPDELVPNSDQRFLASLFELRWT